jgi:hypothetical protein
MFGRTSVGRGSMSAFGTEQTLRGWVPMSAFGGKADIARLVLNVR